MEGKYGIQKYEEFEQIDLQDKDKFLSRSNNFDNRINIHER